MNLKRSLSGDHLLTVAAEERFPIQVTDSENNGSGTATVLDNERMSTTMIVAMDGCSFSISRQSVTPSMPGIL